MKKQIIIPVALAFIILMNLLVVSAEVSYVFKLDEDVNYRFRCVDTSNVYCDNTTLLLMSIEYPNGTNAYDNSSMTHNPTYFNHTIPTSALGQYNTLIISPTVNGTITEFSYDVTPTGKEITSGQGFSSIGIIMAMIFLASLFSFFGFKFSESEKLFPISLFFLLLSLLMGVITMQLAYTYSRDILFSLSTEGLMFKILLGSMWGLMAVAFIALLMLIITTLKELKVRKSAIKNSDKFDGN